MSEMSVDYVRDKEGKSQEIKSTRGEIYDRNGVLLAYNELAYAVTIEDDGTIRIEGTKSEWTAGVVPPILPDGTMPEITDCIVKAGEA